VLRGTYESCGVGDGVKRLELVWCNVDSVRHDRCVTSCLIGVITVPVTQERRGRGGMRELERERDT
jgi:hypothetical protein